MLRSRGLPQALLTFLLTVGTAWACTDADLTYGGPLDLSVTTNSPVDVSDSLIVDFDVTGRNLLGLALTWGDGTVDSVFFAGAQTAGGRRAHLYGSHGSYTVTATVTDGREGVVSEDLSVTVNP